MATDEIIYCEFLDLNGKAVNPGETFSQIAGKLKSNTPRKKVVFNLENVFISDELIKSLLDFHEEYEVQICCSSVYGTGKGLRRLLIDSSGCPIYIAETREEAFNRICENMEEIE